MTNSVQNVEDLEDISFKESLALHRERRRSVLLRKTSAVLAEHGVRQITMDKLAKEVGVTKVVLYRYFKSKDELVNCLLHDFVEKLMASDGRDGGWGTQRLMDNLAVIRDNQSTFMLMMKHLSHDPSYQHHRTKLLSLIKKSTKARLLLYATPPKNHVITTEFFIEQICEFILNAFVGWIDSGDEENDKEFVVWQVKSIMSMIDAWLEKKLDKEKGE